MSNFDKAIDRLLGNEGGYVFNPADPGGETNWGISKRSYPNLDIKSVTKDVSKALYRRDFWDALGLDSWHPAIAEQMLDFAVNSGNSNAVRALQRAVGVNDDGHIGPVTLAAVKAQKPSYVVMNLLAERIEFMTKCSTWQTFGKGWARRIATQLKYGAQDV